MVIEILHNQSIHIHVHPGRGHAEQPCWNAAMNVNVLEPFNNSTAAVWRWFEMVTGHRRRSSQHIIIFLWKLIVLVVYEGVGVLALLRVIDPLLNFDKAISLGH